MTLVVSPLIALMKDQVDGLRANGIAADFLNSSLDNAIAADVERRAQAGGVSLLYAAPERVSMPGFRRFLSHAGLADDRHRRGALHQRVGARFPPRLSRPVRIANGVSRHADDGADGHRHRAGAAGHC